MSDGSAPDNWSGKAYLIDAGGSRSLHLKSIGPADVFQIGLLEEGEYDIEIVAQRGNDAEFARTSVSITDGDVIDLGVVPLSGLSGPFGTSPQTKVTVSPTALLPGGVVTARLVAVNGGDAVADGVLSLSVPFGTTVTPGSVLLDGTPVAFSETDGWLDVALGAIGAGESHTLRAWLETETDFPSDQVVTQGRVSYVDGGHVTELLGLAVATVNRVSIDAPRITDVRTLIVSGRAPAGETVEVLADGIPLGATTATPGGLWNMRIELPETPLRRGWALQAVAASGATTVESELRGIVWDPSHNPLERVVMRQDGGAAVEWRPTDGVARFPFVHAGDNAIDVRLYFKDPDRVEWATASVGKSPSGRGDAIYRDRAPDCFNAVSQLVRRAVCYWEATVIPGSEELGNIFVAWDSDAVEIDLSPTPAPGLLSEQDLRAQLRAPFNGFEDLVVVDEPSGTDISMSVPSIEGLMGVTLEATPGVYAPTVEDLAIEEDTGYPIYGVESLLELTDDLYRVTVDFFVPDSAKTSSAVRSGPPGVSPQAVPGVEIPGEFFVLVFYVEQDSATSSPASKGDLAVQSAGAQAAAAVVGVGSAVYGAVTNPWDQLQNASDHASSFCSPAAAAEFASRAEQIADNLMAQFGVNVATNIIGLAFGPVGSLVAALVSAGLDAAMSSAIEGQIRRLIDDLANHPDCQPPPEDPEEEPPGDKEAEPTWIHDPSGYTYEVFEDNRLEGVTATVQFSDTADGPWEIWDAEWYLQENPQLTDPEGRYGWDVPEGWWRVRFEKVGYETAYSEALKVLPPHFDVNVPLVSLSPPVIASGTGYAENTFLEVSFENYVMSDWVNDFNVAVTDEGDNPVPVVISVVGERTTGDGDDVAKVFRFDTGGQLTLHDEYTVTFDQSVPSYAGIPAGEHLEVVIEIGTLDPFTDDDDSEFEDDIEWMYNQGVLMACNPPANDMVCPDELVSREMVASYFVALLDLTDDGGGDLFVDDDGTEHESDIDKLAAARITFGCNPPTNDMFCPDAFVTRGEIAAFFARALGLLEDGGGDWFVDDDHSVFEGDIDKLRAAAITYGCNPPTNDMYCPDGWLTKGQISALFHRALG